jgi:hypothetical protein
MEGRKKTAPVLQQLQLSRAGRFAALWGKRGDLADPALLLAWNGDWNDVR